ARFEVLDGADGGRVVVRAQAILGWGGGRPAGYSCHPGLPGHPGTPNEAGPAPARPAGAGAPAREARAGSAWKPGPARPAGEAGAARSTGPAGEARAARSTGVAGPAGEPRSGAAWPARPLARIAGHTRPTLAHARRLRRPAGAPIQDDAEDDVLRVSDRRTNQTRRDRPYPSLHATLPFALAYGAH